MLLRRFGPRQVRWLMPSLLLAVALVELPGRANAQSLLPSAVPPIAVQKDETLRANVMGAAADSLKLLAVEHITRLALQEKTRRELRGPFWSDYRRSVRMPRRWEDSDGWLVNYVGHPIHGAAAGFVWIEHDPRSRREEFGLNGRYWSTRWRATAWSAGYSLQFEIGPLSEASIGNVGLRPETTGWVDYVVTPIGAFGIVVAEDALDRFFVRWIEEHTSNRLARATLRMVCNPARTLSNLAASRPPWHRDTRSLDWSR